MEENKIGILTFHRADNLGAVLQAFALQNTLKDKYLKQVEIIDYRCDAVERTRGVRKEQGFKGFIKNFLKSGYYAIKRRGFDRFRAENLEISHKVYTRNNIKESLDFYDCFIAGSDQIWNLECSSYDLTYFLDFVTACKRKFSYAASIGNYKFTEMEEKLIADHIKNLSGISVREESAKETLLDMGVGNVSVLPDPVFLLKEEEWKSVMKKRLYEGKYVLVYLIQEDVNVLKCAEEYARKNGFKLINNKKSLEFILHNSPDEFLSWVYYSECVFTNSFHGTAFSLIFGKDLGADIELKNGGINSRVYELLKKSYAEECIINKGISVPFKPEAEEYIEEMRNLAFEFLEKI